MILNPKHQYTFTSLTDFYNYVGEQFDVEITPELEEQFEYREFESTSQFVQDVLNSDETKNFYLNIEFPDEPSPINMDTEETVYITVIKV